MSGRTGKGNETGARTSKGKEIVDSPDKEPAEPVKLRTERSVYIERYFQFELSVVGSLCLSLSISISVFSVYSVYTELSYFRTVCTLCLHNTLPHNIFFYMVIRPTPMSDSDELSPFRISCLVAMFRCSHSFFISASFTCIRVIDVVEAWLIKLYLPSSSSRSPGCRNI